MTKLMEVPNHWSGLHFKGITDQDRKFVYCPVGNICSWSIGDYDNEWCHWCKIFYKTDMWPLRVPDQLEVSEKAQNKKGDLIVLKGFADQDLTMKIVDIKDGNGHSSILSLERVDE